MRKRLIGYGIAGVVLIIVSIVSAVLTHRRAPVVANLDFTLKDAAGHDVRLASFKGKPLIVNFWASWCVPCQIETPELVELSEKYKDRGLTILGISTDDTPEEVREYAKKFGVTYPLVLGSDRTDVADAFAFGDGIPLSIFIRADGTIATRLEGINTRQWFEQQIQDLF
jgi:thiol-disulfide isomerase/thioredoxin